MTTTRLTRSQKVGAGHIFCVADSFDEILRQLSPEYFAAAHARLTTCLKLFGIKIPLRLGWMHSGYACPLPDSEIPGMWEPAGLFGWVTASPNGDPLSYGSKLPQIVVSLTAAAPVIQWATCSARLFRYLRIEADDYVAAHRLFIDSAVSEPSDWAASVVVAEHRLPCEPWRRLCFAVANQDQELERESWNLAAHEYSPSAVELLLQGIEHTRRCLN